MKKKSNAILVLFVFVCGLISAVAQDNSAIVKTNAAAEKRGYTLGIGDEIELKVIGEPQFDGKYTVDEDGQIKLPFVDKPISAVCRTQNELEAEITTALKKYLREPQLSARITEKRSRPPAVVYGEVRAPQQFDMRRSVTLQELIAYTGGATEQASGLVQVFHTQPQACTDVLQPLASADGANLPSKIYRMSDVREGKLETNAVVYPGDIIIVLKSAPVYIIGEVVAPQGVYIPERGLTLNDAIGMVGGLTQRAKKKDVKIYRLKPNSTEREVISVNLNLIKEGKQANPVLQPYDQIEVERAPKSITKVLLEVATGGITTAITSAAQLPLRVVY